jgi:hypothetical protein
VAVEVIAVRVRTLFAVTLRHKHRPGSRGAGGARGTVSAIRGLPWEGFVSFGDPDGNTWAVRGISTRVGTLDAAAPTFAELEERGEGVR